LRSWKGLVKNIMQVSQKIILFWFLFSFVDLECVRKKHEDPACPILLRITKCRQIDCTLYSRLFTQELSIYEFHKRFGNKNAMEIVTMLVSCMEFLLDYNMLSLLWRILRPIHRRTCGIHPLTIRIKLK